MSYNDVGPDHCRVVPPSDLDTAFAKFEFLRHSFPYAEVLRQLTPKSNILEVGSGEGYGAGSLSVNGNRMVATDLSWVALRHLQAFYPNVLLAQSLGEGLPFPSAMFDAVISFQVIEHIQNAPQYLQEIRRMMKAAGVFYLTTPNRKLRLWDFEKPWNPYHVHEYSGTELLGLLKKYFKHVEVKGVMASGELMQHEIERVRPSLRRFLSVNLRQRLPKLHSCIIRVANPAGTAVAEWPLMAERDFSLSSSCNDSLDLFAICKSE